MHFDARRLMLSAIFVAIVGVGLAACGGEDAPPSQGSARNPPARSVTLPRGVTARLPSGWELLRKPITGVTYPVQVLAAASYPVKLGKRPPGCHPGQVLDQRPPGGVLVQVIEYTRRPKLVERMPPRERPFRLPRSNYATYECAGRGYNVAFRDHGRTLQAFVMLDRQRVDRRTRQQTIELLDSMRFDPDRLARCPYRRHPGFDGSNWGARVSGISCAAAGRFIEREIFPRAARIATEDEVRAAGFRCDVSELTAEPGWRVACERPDKRFRFNWTP